MTTATPTPAARAQASADDVLALFADSHTEIVAQMERLRRLPERMRADAVAADIRVAAAEFHRFFNRVVLAHHDEEEHALFPALRKSAERGDEAGMVDSIVHRLEQEHRQLEELWDRIEPALRRIGRGKPATLDATSVEALVSTYLEHARFEEAAVLPLAKKVLDGGDQAALALVMAMRRHPTRVLGYI